MTTFCGLFFTLLALSYIFTLLSLYVPRLLSRDLLRTSRNPKIAWKLGLHLLFFLISMRSAATIGVTAMSTLFSTSFPEFVVNPCNSGRYVVGYEAFRNVMISNILFMVRGIADPVLHIVWEPVLRKAPRQMICCRK